MTERKDYENIKLFVCLLILICSIYLYIRVKNNSKEEDYIYSMPRYYTRPESVEKNIDNSSKKILIEYTKSQPILHQSQPILHQSQPILHQSQQQIDNLLPPPRQIKHSSNMQKYHKR